MLVEQGDVFLPQMSYYRSPFPVFNVTDMLILRTLL